jgi:trimeric autotransporter adhesin
VNQPLGTEGMVITENGDVGIQTLSPQYALDVNGIIRGDLVSPSDVRLKKDITPIPDALDRLLQLEGVNFHWIGNRDNNRMNMGIVAQEVEKQFPEAVRTDERGFKAVSYDKLVAPMIEAMKEQQKQIEALKKEVEDLKKEY